MFSSRKSIFSLCDLDMRLSRTILKIVTEGHKRIISAKCSQNQGSSLGGEVLEAIVDDTRRTNNNARRTKDIQ